MEFWVYPSHKPWEVLSVGGSAFYTIQSREDRDDEVVFWLSVFGAVFLWILKLVDLWDNRRCQVVITLRMLV